MTTEMTENNSKNTTDYRSNSVDCVGKTKNEETDYDKIKKSVVELNKNSVWSVHNKYVIVK